jgi:hypothetical protein
MKLYQFGVRGKLYHSLTGPYRPYKDDSYVVRAESFDEAVKKCGLMPGDCYLIRAKTIEQLEDGEAPF